MYCLHYGSVMYGPGENVMQVCYIHYNMRHDSRGDTCTAYTMVQKCMVLARM